MVAGSETAGAGEAVQVVEVEDRCGEGVVDPLAPPGRVQRQRLSMSFSGS
ncbi:hypothetical protein [Streptomyces sp. BF23-18]